MMISNATSQGATVEELLTRNKELQEQLSFYARELENSDKTLSRITNFDALTGLINRSVFYKTLEHTLARARRYGEQFAVLYINLDKFKTINETYGVEGGDSLLKEFARRLVNLLHDNDYIARINADEFMVLMERVEDVNDCAIVAQKINDLMQKPYEVRPGVDIYVTNSIGIAVYPSSGHSVEELMKNADAATVKAKELGHNGFQYYTEQYDTDAKMRLSLEKDLREAVEKREFQLYYQPIYNVKTRKIVGAEALIRWNHPSQGMVPPYDFIPIAEKSGLIVPMGKWVMNEACEFCVRLRREEALVPISVNLSAKQFREKGLRDTIKDILYEKNLDPRFLTLELTEGTLVQDVERAREILVSLTNIGIRISIDDFGTGYSSLAYLRKFPLHTLKIDKSFIDNVAREDKDHNIVKFIIDLAHNLNLDVVAEGVEDEEQFRFLHELGCDKVQGYYFSKPVPEANFFELLKAQRG